MIQRELAQKIRTIAAKYTAAQNPTGPAADAQPFIVRLQPIISAADQMARWDAPQQWCRQHVDHAAGALWSRRMDRISERPEFSFSDADTAVWFRLAFS
jgi:hypothetical protein